MEVVSEYRWSQEQVSLYKIIMSTFNIISTQRLYVSLQWSQTAVAVAIVVIFVVVSHY